VDSANAKIGVAGTNADKRMRTRTPSKPSSTSSTAKARSIRNSSKRTTSPVKSSSSLRLIGPRRFQSPSPRPHKASQKARTSRRTWTRSRGALFIDGAVYPHGVLYWVLLDKIGWMTSIGTWEKPDEIVRNYIDNIDTQYERGFPAVSVVKTSTISQLLDAFDDKLAANDILGERGTTPDVPWTRDHQFIAEVLRDESLEHLSYTPWFVHE